MGLCNARACVCLSHQWRAATAAGGFAEHGLCSALPILAGREVIASRDRAFTADIDRRLLAPCCRRRCSAEDAGSVLLRADGGGSTRTCICLCSAKKDDDDCEAVDVSEAAAGSAFEVRT